MAAIAVVAFQVAIGLDAWRVLEYGGSLSWMTYQSVAALLLSGFCVYWVTRRGDAEEARYVNR